MGNLINSIKKVLGNKNTVTFLGVIACVLVLFFFYNYRVKSATTPIKVPYAKEEMYAATKIDMEKVGTVEINEKFLKNSDIIRNSGELEEHYITTGTSIPKGGLFYKSQVVTKADLPNSIFDEIQDGETIFYLSVNNETTYGNSIYPGDKIDLYMKATDETGKIMFGMFIQSITVLGVRDGNNKDVFGGASTGLPAQLLFAVPNDSYELLMKTKYISGVSLVPVPRNKNYTKFEGEAKTSEFLKDFILAKAAVIPENN